MVNGRLVCLFVCFVLLDLQISNTIWDNLKNEVLLYDFKSSFFDIFVSSAPQHMLELALTPIGHISSAAVGATSSVSARKSLGVTVAICFGLWLYGASSGLWMHGVQYSHVF